MMNSCIFCDIIAGNAMANFVARQDCCVAFMDIHPVNPGHVLIVPLIHASLVYELDDLTLGQMMVLARSVDNALRACGLKCEGVNLFLADGRAAGQDVMHVHLHVIPRFAGDGHHLRFSPAYFEHPTPANLEEAARRIREQMDDSP